MKTKWFIAIGLLTFAAVAFVLTSMVASRKPEPRAALVKDQRHELVAPSAATAPTPAPKAEQMTNPEVPPARAFPTSVVQPDLTPATRPKKSKPPIQDPVARAALSFVGADPAAEEYWYSAINDSTLSPHERKDLIEDLNEDGLSNPKHPGSQDMPLIWSRIQLIEGLAPYAMDEVNAAAFAEAYKDLLNLAGGQSAQ